MAQSIFRSSVFLACLLAACGGGANSNGDNGMPETSPPPPNTLTADQRADGWRLLFNGADISQWRGFQMDSLPSGWQAVDGALTRVGPGADIITKDEFANFDLRLEWMISPKGNSGIMYRVTEADSATYRTGPEMQVLDDAGHPDGASRLTSAGSVYGLYPAPEGVVKPAGEWNDARIVVQGNHVEHWLNGQKIAEYELGSPEWEGKVKQSKFDQWKGYGRAASGHIALQDHGDRVAYRDIRIKVLP